MEVFMRQLVHGCCAAVGGIASALRGGAMWMFGIALVGCAQGAVDPSDNQVTDLSGIMFDASTPAPTGGSGSGGSGGGPICGTTACDKTCCMDRCVDLTADMNHCGMCGRACGVGTRCMAGQCSCPESGTTLCNNACVDTQTDDDNCGMCGKKCMAPTTCMAGACKCPNGSTGDTICGDTCVDTQRDSSNCGGCGMA
jgi:hypothetical protein